MTIQRYSQISMEQKSRTFLRGEGAYKVLNYRNTADFIANYRRTVEVFHTISDFRLRHVVLSPNTEQNLPKLPFHRTKNCQIPYTVISYAPPLHRSHDIEVTRKIKLKCRAPSCPRTLSLVVNVVK